ncbi:hypothetical protein LJC58_08945 [Lachnospiraceae bacterium OttesenSCG-928-D06]|nr:hypothetical protein [Lachnospiraceae bacterium OttesenSCG-928-D06]
MSKLFSMSLYFTSFAPLWISVLFIDIKSMIENQSGLWTEKVSVMCIAFCSLISLIVLIFELCENGKEGTNRFVIKYAKEEKTITAEYLLSYILPLFAFDFTTWSGVALFVVFFSTLGFLCIKHNHFSVNIVLELAKFSFYECELKNEDGVFIEKSVISHRKLSGSVGQEIYLKALNNEYSLDIKQ